MLYYILVTPAPEQHLPDQVEQVVEESVVPRSSAALQDVVQAPSPSSQQQASGTLRKRNWRPYNDFDRTYYEKHKKRPSFEEAKKWYEENKHEFLSCNDEIPSWQELKVHRTRFRVDTARIREYTNKKRAEQRAAKAAEQKAQQARNNNALTALAVNNDRSTVLAEQKVISLDLSTGAAHSDTAQHSDDAQTSSHSQYLDARTCIVLPPNPQPRTLVLPQVRSGGNLLVAPSQAVYAYAPYTQLARSLC